MAGPFGFLHTDVMRLPLTTHADADNEDVRSRDGLDLDYGGTCVGMPMLIDKTISVTHAA